MSAPPPYSRADRVGLALRVTKPSPWVSGEFQPSREDVWYTTDGLPRFPMWRIWWYRPFSWQSWKPVQRGGDEFGHHTLVINTYLFGALVVPTPGASYNRAKGVT